MLLQKEITERNDDKLCRNAQRLPTQLITALYKYTTGTQLLMIINVTVFRYIFNVISSWTGSTNDRHRACGTDAYKLFKSNLYQCELRLTEHRRSSHLHGQSRLGTKPPGACARKCQSKILRYCFSNVFLSLGKHV